MTCPGCGVPDDQPCRRGCPELMSVRERRDARTDITTFTFSLTGLQLAQMRGHISEHIARTAAEALTMEFLQTAGPDILAKVDREAIRAAVEKQTIDNLVKAMVR